MTRSPEGVRFGFPGATGETAVKFLLHMRRTPGETEVETGR